MLLETQMGFARFLLSGDFAPISGAIVEERISARMRLMVHRSNVMGSLVTVLRERYPAVARVLGEDRFRSVAAGFVALHPPLEPRLSSYGEGFAADLAEAEETAAFGHAADLARLEWARHACAYAPEPPALELAALQAVPPSRVPELRLRPHPAMAILDLAHRVSPLWVRITQENGAADTPPEAGTERLWLRRQERGVAQRELPEAEFAFLRALAGDATLAASAEAAQALDAQFDLTSCLASHLLSGSFSGFQLTPQPSDPE